MKVGFKMYLNEGQENEYQKRHDEIWPELKILLKKTGISDYSIFLDKDTNTLFGVLTVEDESRLEELPKTEIMQKWWLYMSDIMQTHSDHSPINIPLKAVFYME